jgi:tRNA pseudouridine38-40 synthase
MRFKGILAFDGTGFQGWQTQQQGQSIQEEVENVLSKMLNQPIKVHGASRTDAGVHAEAFVFHLDATTSLQTSLILKGFNRLVHPQLVLRQFTRVSPTFESRFSYSKKTYRYQLYTGERNPFLSRYAHYYYLPLDLALLKKTILLFKGHHCFHNFTVKPDDDQSFFRTMYRVKVTAEDALVMLTLTGSGFMTHMVRMIVGTCLAVQEGKWTLHDVEQALKSTSIRQPVSFKAPSHGLYLQRVQYEKTR